MRSSNVEQRGGLWTNRKNSAVLFLALSNFLVTFDITAVVVAMPTIRADLDLGISGFAWVMDAYSLAFVILLTTAGAVADRFGARSSLIFGILVFLLGSVLCAAAPVPQIMWLGRGIQGCGSAFVICGALALLSRLFSDRSQRIKAFAFAGTVTGIAMALGPSIGGFLTEILGWRWVFWINIGIVAVIVSGVLFTIDRDRASELSTPRFDIAGVLSLTLFLSTSIWFLLHGPEVAGYTLPAWSAVLVVMGALALFITTQKVQSEAACFRTDVFRSRQFIGMCFVPVGVSIGYWSVLVYLPLLLSNAFDLSIARASWLMLVLTLPMVFLPFLGSKLAQKATERVFFGTGIAALALGCSLVGLGAFYANLMVVLTGMAVAGISTAIINAQISGAIVAMVPTEKSGAASAIATTMRQGGFAVGIALLGAVLKSSVSQDLSTAGAQEFAPLFFVASLCSVIAAALVFTFLRQSKSEETPSFDKAQTRES